MEVFTMKTTNEVQDIIPQEEPVQQEETQVSDSEKIISELTAINMNIAQMLEEQQKHNAKMSKMATDIKSIKTVAVFFLILGIIAMFPLFGSVMGACVKLL